MTRQRGFIQNFIIPGIILIGVVIAGIAMLASNSGGSDFSNEKASMVANAVMGTSMTFTEAIQRAEADGAQVLPGALDDSSVLVAGRYLTATPSLPQGLTSSGAYYSANTVRLEGGGGYNFGGYGADEILLIDLGVDAAAEQTCRRINNRAFGVSIMAADNLATFTTGAIAASHAAVELIPEGCAQAGASAVTPFDPPAEYRYVYYKLIHAKGNGIPYGGAP